MVSCVCCCCGKVVQNADFQWDSHTTLVSFDFYMVSAVVWYPGSEYWSRKRKFWWVPTFTCILYGKVLFGNWALVKPRINFYQIWRLVANLHDMSSNCFKFGDSKYSGFVCSSMTKCTKNRQNCNFSLPWQYELLLKWHLNPFSMFIKWHFKTSKRVLF